LAGRVVDHLGGRIGDELSDLGADLRALVLVLDLVRSGAAGDLRDLASSASWSTKVIRRAPWIASS
jgi:hypothetical protein